MGHYAKIVDGTVVEVIVAEAEFFDTFVDSSAGNWIQTSYNTYGGQHQTGGTPLRYNFAGVGFTYDSNADAFYGPSPYLSWVLNTSTYLWQAPVAYPDDGEEYDWNEQTKSWDKI